MSYADTRTGQYEAHIEALASLRADALDMTTAARHYHSLADTIERIPSEGGQLFVEARADLASMARDRAAVCTKASARLTADADAMERKGLS